VQQFDTDVIPCRATFFALLPEKAPEPKLTLSETTAVPGDVVTARLSVPGLSGLHALRIRATAPDGSAAEWLNQVVIVGRDGAEVPVPVALNDPAGEWTIRAIDLYTDRAATATLSVKGAKQHALDADDSGDPLGFSRPPAGLFPDLRVPVPGGGGGPSG
jgi:hypothetical protein